MPPKKGAKKGGKKNQDDEEFWEKKEAALASTPQAGSDAEDIPQPAKSGKGKKTGGVFDLLDDGDAVEDDDEGGDLMAMIAANAAKKKDKKKNKKQKYDFDDDEDAPSPAAEVDTKPNLDDEWPEDDVKPKKGKKDKKNKKKNNVVDEDEDMAEPPAASEEPSTAVNLDDEWPEEDVKPKKGKKGKKGKKAQDDEEEDLDAILEKAAAERKAAEEAAKAAEPTPAPAPEPAAQADEDEDGDEGPKILTKAQKEKLKKEKEKAKKKAQAAAKKATAPTPAADEATPSAPEPAAEAEEDEGDEEAGGGDKKKKKKKKPAAKAPEPAPAAKGKKVPAHIAAMQAAMEEKKKLEEEARRVEEERLRAIEEEEKRMAEEEARIAEAKAAKKAKEKEKAAKAKAEGRALTPAQKREKAAAEARKQAMLASGMVVAGLQDGGAAPEAKKKVVYGNRKKQQQQKPKETATPPPEPASPAPASTEKKAEPTPAPAKEESEDEWDKSEDEVEKVVAEVEKLKVEESEDDWDKSSDEETPAPAPVPAAKPAAPAAKATPAPAPATATAPATAKSAPKANGKPAPAEESSSEEESSEEETDSDDDDDSDDESDSEDEAAARKALALEKIEKRKQAAQAAGSKEDLRSPICCILGHVDHGKTKLLDQIRQTSVAEGEAGGITQQIGATFFPKSAIVEKTAVVNPENETDVKIPGLLIIDTPGHESFSNLRTRGSSLCNIAILVVDITQGLEPQTIESINLLKKGRTPFIVALNKIDRMYGWEAKKNAGFRETLNSQKAFVKSEFEDRVKAAKLAFAEQGFNAELFDENKNLGRNISLVPTSAITGEGIPDMLLLLVKLTQERMNANLMYISELECTILEVKIIEGLGTTIDVILSNGVMKEGDKIVLCGSDGPIVTNVRALLTPQPLRELRIKSAYVHNKEVKAALGVKISAPGLEKAIAGAKLYVAHDDDEVEAYKDMAMDDLSSLAKFVTKSGKGVWVQASTLGSLEALLTFLQQMKIPVFNFGIGPVYKSTIVKAGIMLDRAPEYAVIMAFDVTIEKEAEELAKKAGMKVFSSMVIYHLFDAFQKYMAEVQESRRKEAAPNAVWPVRMKILKAFAHRDPIILGCDIIEGSMRVGTPVGVVKVDKASGKREIITLGKITSLEINHKPFTIVKKAQVGAGVAVKIERAPYQTARMFNRHFDEHDEVVSLITRQSIDTLKTTFRDQVEMGDWAIIKKMKTEQGVA
ncbi:translation initiation factor aIF-2 [Kwoniella dejecticola CBS 10117]|uniref:Eukaryotic translation initiation factor 5B n=1 Tax=Kwoniella dejecticola CBS 10117 TaxID=1296121 RepID=A0A1A6A843_9TREE|nr:translation initiation factor aIF-2 [Kwoniella dejecticola CBS 10117]OBR86234.1 translation initiation factor aIF-2 [Kwoniella dejecticola CBS 10117]